VSPPRAAEPPQPPQPPSGAPAHWHVGEHAIKGLVSLVWVEPGKRPGSAPAINLNADMIAPLYAALGKFLREREQRGREAG
jgi:hypothetical protein